MTTQPTAEPKVATYDLQIKWTQPLADAVRSIFGQLSDGKWENSPRMIPFWIFQKSVVKLDNGNLGIEFRTEYSREWGRNVYFNPWVVGGVVKPHFTARKLSDLLYAIVRDEGYKFKDDPSIKLDYLTYDYKNNPVTIGVAAELRKALLKLAKFKMEVVTTEK